MRKKYSAIVRGENFLLSIENEVRIYGFVTTRNVKASSVEDAIAQAIALVENDSELQQLMEVKQDLENPPTLYVDELYHLGWWKRLGGKGFTFFSQEDNSD